jgi:hypothetical protein
VTPQAERIARVRWLWSANPARAAALAGGTPAASSASAASRRRWRAYAVTGTPTWSRNVRARCTRWTPASRASRGPRPCRCRAEAADTASQGGSDAPAEPPRDLARAGGQAGSVYSAPGQCRGGGGDRCARPASQRSAQGSALVSAERPVSTSSTRQRRRRGRSHSRRAAAETRSYHPRRQPPAPARRTRSPGPPPRAGPRAMAPELVPGGIVKRRQAILGWTVKGRRLECQPAVRAAARHSDSRRRRATVLRSILSDACPAEKKRGHEDDRQDPTSRASRSGPGSGEGRRRPGAGSPRGTGVAQAWRSAPEQELLENPVFTPRRAAPLPPTSRDPEAHEPRWVTAREDLMGGSQRRSPATESGRRPWNAMYFGSPT